MIVYLWAEASCSSRWAEAGAIFCGQSVKRDFHEKSTFFSLLLSSVRKTRITCSPESVGGVPCDAGPCRANEKTTFLHVSPVIYLFFHPFIVYSFPVSSAKAFAVFILFSLPARDILFYLVSSPILCYDFFFYDFKAWGFYKPDKRILCEMCCTESFGLNRKLSDVISRAGLFYVILNLNWYFYYASAALWASVLCTISRPASPEQKTLLHWHPMATRAGRLYIEYSWYFCTQLFECAFLSLTSLMVVLQYQNQDLCLIHFHESLQTVFFNESP